MDEGRRTQLKRFYASINEGTPPPIAYREILLTARIMDSIFTQLQSAAIGKSSNNAAVGGLPLDTGTATAYASSK